MILSAHQPQYLPYLGFFHKIACSDAFVWLDDVQYKKREYQNRNRIRTPEGSSWLTVPVKTSGRRLQAIRDVEPDEGFGWRRDHWEALRRNYARAPQFGRHAGFFESLYSRPWPKLDALCRSIADYLFGVFGISTPTRSSSEFSVQTVSTQRLVDLCRAAGADAYLSGAGGKDYLEAALFEKAGVKLLWQSFEHPIYKQAFPGYEPYLSAVDFAFNVEPDEAKRLFSQARRGVSG